jgi:3-oxoacyl-[acyl-carrier protein] reductase
MLNGKKALVTGAARGIGLGIAQVLSEAGAELLMHYRRDSEAMHEIKGHYFQAELDQTEGIEALFSEVDRLWGKLDIAVNNAGWSYGGMPWESIDYEKYRKLTDINIRGTLFCCLNEMKRMPDGGSIINIGSVQMNSTVPGWTLYAMSKGAIHSMTGALALEGGPLGIRVNNIAPGYIEVERMSTRPGFDAAEIAGAIPLRRLGAPRDIGECALFLASEQSSFITGQSIIVDGGVERKLARNSK